MKARYKVAIGFAGFAVVGATMAPQTGFGQEGLATIGFDSHESKLDRVVTKHFDHANVNQVLAWLVEQGFNYVVKDGEFDQTSVCLDIENQTVLQAAQSLADALDGRWEREGHAYVFHKNGDGENKGDDGENVSTSVKTAEGTAMAKLMQANNAEPVDDSGQSTDNVNAVSISNASDSGWTDDQQKALNEQMSNLTKDLSDRYAQGRTELGAMGDEQGSAFERHIENWSKEFASMFPSAEMTDEQQGAFENQMAQWGEKLGDQLSHIGDKLGELNSQQKDAFKSRFDEWSDKIGNSIEGMNSDQESAFEKQVENLGTMFAAQYDQTGEQIEQMTGQQQKEFERQWDDWGKKFAEEYSKNGKNSAQWKAYQKQMGDWGRKFAQQFGKEGQWGKQNSAQWKAYEKQMQDWSRKFSDEYAKNMKDSPQWKDYQKQMDDWGKQFAQQYGKDGQSSKQWEEYAKKWSDWGQKFGDEWKTKGGDLKEMPPIPDVPMPPMPQIGKVPMPPMPPVVNMVPVPPMPPMPKVDMKIPPMPQMPKMNLKMPPMPPVSDGAWLDIQVTRAGHDGRSIGASTKGIEKLLNTLTPEQERIEHTRGYLKISDLSSTQRGYIENPSSDGDWVLTFREHGKTLKLRSK